MTDEQLEAPVREMLCSVGICGDFLLRRLKGGGNNRVYLVETPETRLFLKRYYQDDDNKARRLNSEFTFSTFAWNAGVNVVPRPVAKNEEMVLALYEYIEGAPLAPEDVDERSVREALHFFLALNNPERVKKARTLPNAAEACFSIEDHMRCVERRIESLFEMDTNTLLCREAKRFVEDELSVRWHLITERIKREVCSEGFDISLELADEDRCVSPSDFGFHNALRLPNGSLRFFDFEYSGWDDPAKMICDFFCQPALPVPYDHWEMFATAVAELFVRKDFHLQRFSLLLPVYQMKWCCIILNPFLSVGSNRRKFAMRDELLNDYKKVQLFKAKQLVQSIE